METASHQSVLQQIEKIRYVFQHALYMATTKGQSETEVLLENTDSEFRAVAYEGAAMGLSLKDIAEGTLIQWRSFMRSCNVHYLPHVHVGLGWAVAKQKIPSLLFLETLDPLMLARVVDGCGYYDGTFRQIQTLHSKVRPMRISAEAFPAYDQGVGRSIWYHHQGNSSEVIKMIQSFSAERHADLWRGVGIACSFVGRSAEQTLYELSTASEKHQVQLAIGAAFTARARIQTNSRTEDSEMGCRIWSGLSAKESMTLAVQMEPSGSSNPYHPYVDWLTKMESAFSKISKISIGA